MNKEQWILTGIIVTIVVSVGEFFVDTWLDSQYTGYDWTRKSISYLGQAGSPLSMEVAVWGICFSICFSGLAIGFYQAFRTKGLWVEIASMMILLYGIGEGIGAGFFPINPPGTPYTTAAFFYNLFGAIGDTAMVLLPLVLMWKVFPRSAHPRFFYLSLVVLVLGLLLAILFLTAKSLQPTSGFLIYKGLWQRLYLLNYNIYYLAIAVKMWQQIKQ